MNVVAGLILDNLGTGERRLKRYSDALARSFAKVQPVFSTARYGNIHRAASINPVWSAASLITSAEREADGSGRLWSLSACTPDEETATLVKQHAIDESVHSRWYVRVLDLTFAGAVDETLRAHLNQVSPRFTREMQPEVLDGSLFAHEVTVDDLIQMNIAEIRTAVNQRLQSPMLLAHCPEQNRPRVRSFLDRLFRDEIRHVQYSAALIDRAAERDNFDVRGLFIERLQDLDEITRDEVDREEFPLHCSTVCMCNGPRLHARRHAGRLLGSLMELEGVEAWATQAGLAEHISAARGLALAACSGKLLEVIAREGLLPSSFASESRLLVGTSLCFFTLPVLRLPFGRVEVSGLPQVTDEGRVWNIGSAEEFLHWLSRAWLDANTFGRLAEDFRDSYANHVLTTLIAGARPAEFAPEGLTGGHSYYPFPALRTAVSVLDVLGCSNISPSPVDLRLAS